MSGNFFNLVLATPSLHKASFLGAQGGIDFAGVDSGTSLLIYHDVVHDISGIVIALDSWPTSYGSRALGSSPAIAFEEHPSCNYNWLMELASPK